MYQEDHGDRTAQEINPISCLWTPRLTWTCTCVNLNRLLDYENRSVGWHRAGPSLVTGRHTQGTDLKSPAKTLKTELLLELRPAEGGLELVDWIQSGQLPVKTKNIKIFPIGFTHEPESHYIHLECERYNPKLFIIQRSRKMSNRKEKREMPLLRWHRFWN